MPFDCVWFTQAREQEALQHVRRLDPIEVAIRRLEQMRGLRICPGAPIPGAAGVVADCQGNWICRNFLGSRDLAPGARQIATVDGQQQEIVCITRQCGHVTVLAPGLAGADFLPEFWPTVDGVAKEQAEVEAQTRALMDLRQQTRLEHAARRMARDGRLVTVAPITLLCSVVAGLANLLAAVAFDLPAKLVCDAFERVRARRRRAILREPFSPLKEAHAMISGMKRGVWR